MARIAFNDDQLWRLVHVHSDVSDVALAKSLGVQISTIHAARWRLRKHGWTCRVSYGTCRYCGKPFTRQGHKASRREYHPECYLANKREHSPPREKRRWQSLSASEQAAIIDRAHEHNSRWQELTQAKATNHMKRWQDWEDELILSPDAPPDHELALDLGRSLLSVRGRRRDLKRRQR
jgi:hypothetical protein